MWRDSDQMVSPRPLPGVQLVDCCRKKKNRVEEKEGLWPNLTEGRSGIHESGKPYVWSILTGLFNIQALRTQISNVTWLRS